MYFFFSQNGLINALPNAAANLYSLVVGFLADFLISRQILTKRGVRWLFNDIGFGIPAICFFVFGYTTQNWILCILILSAGMGIRAVQYAGHYQVPYDIAPKYSGTVYGMVNTVGSCSGFVTPLMTSAFTATDPKDVDGWRKLFWIPGSLYFLCVALFMLFARFNPASFEFDQNKENESSEEQEISYQNFDHNKATYGTVTD